MESIRDLSTPDLHFWHASSLADFRQKWVATGDPFYLALVEDCVAYQADKPTDPVGAVHMTWKRADTWHDGQIFGQQF